MKEAHEPGSFHQLSSVKRHIKYAQHTSKDRRTLAQLYLLHHWRRSPASLATHRPTPELFVDASQFGIGLYLGTRWLAWTFRHGHPEIEYGSDGKIDASWAELIAVEIGIFVVLAEGYRCVPISIWSDNMGVVEALKRGTWTANRGLDGISSRILNLCRAHGLSVSPKWIPSKMNPADNASRGAYPPKKMMLSYSPLLPRRLVHFMTKVDLDVSISAFPDSYLIWATNLIARSVTRYQTNRVFINPSTTKNYFHRAKRRHRTARLVRRGYFLLNDG